MKTNHQKNPFLQGNYAPVQDELNVENLEIEGEIPQDLSGVYMRNGPNPAYEPISYTYPFDGDGMLHAVYLEEGKAHYRNRFVETRGLQVERRAGHAVYGGIFNPIMPDPALIGTNGEPGPFKTGAMIHVIRHANKYLALHEAAPGYEITKSLETIGEWQINNQALPVNAHTRYDPVSGELFLITYDIEPPFLSYYRLDKKGDLIEKGDIDKEYSTMMHDFILTENYIIYFDCPAVLDMQAMMTGQEVLKWREDLPTRIGLQSRHDNSIRWIETDPFFVFHFANAYEHNQQIIIDYAHHGGLKILDEAPNQFSPPMMYRSVIDLASMTISHQQIDDAVIEFPRIKDDINSRYHQYIYCAGQRFRDNKKGFNAIFKYDCDNQVNQWHDFGEDNLVSEPVFAPSSKASAEDEGYVMLYVYDPHKNNSDFVILDAQNLNDKPLARVRLPRRIPQGLHGSWMPDLS